MSNIPDHEDPENTGSDDEDGVFSTSDFFKRWQEIEEEEREEKQEIIESISEELEDFSKGDVEDICDQVTQLIHHSRKRNNKDQWDEIFDRLRRADLWGNPKFDKRVHNELLREFGYKSMSGQLDKKLRRMDKPPIRPKVIRHIFRTLNWRGDKTDRLLAQQRLWLLVSSGAIPEPHKRTVKKRHKKKSKRSGGCFWIILILALIFIFMT